MSPLPEFEVRAFAPGEPLPREAEELFQKHLAHARAAPASDRPNGPAWRFALTCAVTSTGHVLGGVHLDIGPIGGAGPLRAEKLAYLERTYVRPEYRRRGLATQLLRKAIEIARDAGCLHIRCGNNWDNEAERRLFLECGFALVDLDGESDAEPCYLAVRPLRQSLMHGPAPARKDLSEDRAAGIE